MTIDDEKTRDEKLQYNINKEAAKILQLSSGKVDKYEYLTSEEILASDKKRVIEQVKFTYSPLRIAMEKQTKTIEDQGEKQIKAIEEHGKQLVKSNAFAEKESTPFDKKKESVSLDKQKEILYKFVAERTE